MGISIFCSNKISLTLCMRPHKKAGWRNAELPAPASPPRSAAILLASALDGGPQVLVIRQRCVGLFPAIEASIARMRAMRCCTLAADRSPSAGVFFT